MKGTKMLKKELNRLHEIESRLLEYIAHDEQTYVAVEKLFEVASLITRIKEALRVAEEGGEDDK